MLTKDLIDFTNVNCELSYSKIGPLALLVVLKYLICLCNQLLHVTACKFAVKSHLRE